MRSNISDDQRALTIDDANLPVVDLGGLFADDAAEKAKVAAALGDAARTSGFFYITNHGIPQAQIDALFAASKEFHEKPRRFKMKYWSGFTTHHRGYVPYEENGADFPKSINFNEAWDMSYEAPEDHPDYLAGWRMTGPNIWPDIQGWRETVSGYYDAAFNLGLRLLDALALELGVDSEELTRHITYPTSQLRLLRYIENDLPATKELVGIAAHSDFECFTILLTGSPGLQVMNAEDVWIEAPPIPGCFVVNIGDIFETWSGGQFKSTQHRVTNIGTERYSMPLFFGLDYHTVVEPLEKFRTPETLEKYPPMKAGEHLMRMSVNAFRYMADARAKGDLVLDFEVPEENPFKREAKGA
ncbi:isopenicillin N synthase family dioxygenase [Roseobacter sinensis]|uniref:2-oxoglutarate-dependent ethylene/succinate-forming enzyme n=1 Tax=Roseobacter sinensis TaxID=2931391 RepID=A0ABT3BEA0_9RHOB|nr:2-oxoglutarate and iron-dependent oxygenase domain-containing protein [Roseobacter sp. WL0113]MCV3271880.1 isopenicillin N synthase family oxygenase [Roseobacter sp. WL0113]